MGDAASLHGPRSGFPTQDLVGRLGILLELVSDGVWECDADLRLTEVYGQSTDSQRALGAMLGRRIGDPPDPALPLEDLPRLKAAMQARQPFKNCVYPLSLPGGEREWLRLSGCPLFTTDGQFTGYLGTSARVTEERQRLAAERRRQQLESLGQLAGGVAHEFNNLLVPITMLSKLALPLASNDPILRTYLEIIHENGWKAAQIVRSVLTYARQMTPSATPVACGEVVAERIQLLRQALPPSVAIECDIDDRTSLVLGNDGVLSQIVVNLFNNACDALADRGIIRCSVRRVTLTQDECRNFALTTDQAMRIEISDSGPGIPPEIRDHIFEPFFTTKPVGQGTGLGLSVVDGIVKDWGGHIALTTAPGEGASFTILLPVVETDRQPARQPARRPGAAP